MFERFTQSARQVVVDAQKAAVDLNHAQIGTEHELLGLLADLDGVPVRVLGSLGVTAQRVRERVVEREGYGVVPVTGQVPFTRAAKKVLEMSLREALNDGARSVTPTHILRAMLGVTEGGAAQLLLELDVQPQAVLEALTLFPGAPTPDGPPAVSVRHATADLAARRILGAARHRAAHADHREFGVLDLLAALASDPEASEVLAELRVDAKALSAAIAGRDSPEDLLERFTDAGRQVVALAIQESQSLGHTYIGVEHLWLGLMGEGTSIAAQALHSLGVSLETARADVIRHLPAPDPVQPAQGAAGLRAPFTPRAKRVLELSLREALGLGRPARAIEPEHILLAIARDNESFATAMMSMNGIGSATIRDTVLNLIPNSRPGPGEPVDPEDPQPSR